MATARPIGGAIKGWQSRRLSRQSAVFLEEKRWQDAAKNAHAAYQLRPTEPESWRAIARILTISGQDANAVEWWQKLAAAGRLTADDRRDYAKAALRAGDTGLAAEQIDAALRERPIAAAADLVVAGQIAAAVGDRAEARRLGHRVLTSANLEDSERLAAAQLVISASSPGAEEHVQASQAVVQLASDDNSPASLDALALLAQSRPGSEAVAGTPDDAVDSALPPVEIAQRLQGHPAATASHYLLGLDLLVRTEPTMAATRVNGAVERYRNGSDEDLSQLGAWLIAHRRFETVLEVIPLVRAAANRQLLLRHLDALAGLERFDEILNVLTTARAVLDPVSEHMFMAHARARVGEVAAARHGWERALEAANGVADKLLMLARYAKGAGELQIADAAYDGVIALQPRFRAPQTERLALALQQRDTKKAEQIAGDIAKTWPRDLAARNDYHYLRLLLGATGEEARAIEASADALLMQAPHNWGARATLALARLRDGRPSAAMQAFEDTEIRGVLPSGVLAVHAAVLNANGWREDAVLRARDVIAARLLPEEQALVAPLLAEPAPGS